MQRTKFIGGLIGAVGLTELVQIAPAAAIDEFAVGQEVFAQLRDDGDLLFDSPYYEHLNEVGAVISHTVADRYPYPVQYHVVKGDSANAFSVPGGKIYVNEPLLRMAQNRDELAGVLAHETGHMVLHHVVKGDSANAFSVPGGKIYVNEPLLRMAQNRDELAGVLAHETGHMVLHHVAKRMKTDSTMNTIGTILSIPAAILLGPLGQLPAGYMLNMLQTAQDANVSRHIEAQADEEGARILAATNDFNPYGMIWFFESMTKTYGDKGAFWQRDHPFDSARIADLKTLFAENPSVFKKYDATNKGAEIYW